MATAKRASPVRKFRTRSTLRGEPRSLAFAVGAALLPWTFLHPAYAGAPANTLPSGGQYSYGTGSITPQSGNKLQIDQQTDKGTINWNTFSIGSSAWVNFSQPSASSITVNRVLGNNPSEIFGRMTANGQIFLSNPNGVLFARGASVDVGGLFATTLTISDQDANAGRYNRWSNPGNSKAVVNEGNIISANGYAALAGPQVRNDGFIVARAGSVTLAAGDRVSLDMIGDGLIKVSVDQAAMNASAINSGRIEADGGKVVLTARSANALLDTVVNNSGVIRANSLIERNGEIILDGGSSGVTSNSGSLLATGLDAGRTGGGIKVLGDKVALLGGTRIDASGDVGGGTVLVGGDFQGKNPNIRNASSTTVAEDAYIDANGVTSGNGGRVIVWSDGTTRYDGHISARGGAQSGDGGFAEVSGKQHLVLPRLTGHFDFSSPKGKLGELLLDPNAINVVLLATTPACATAGTCDPAGPLDISALDIQTHLLLGSLTLKTSDSGAADDNININTPLTTSGAAAGAKLTFDANDFVTGFSNLTGTAGTNFTVLVKAELTGSVTKTYDGFNTVSNLGAGNYNIHGLVQGDTVTITKTTGTYGAGKNVGTGLAVTSAPLASGDYSFTAGSVSNYTVATSATGNIGAITKLDTNISGTRVYDAGTTAAAANLGTVGALIAGDVVSVSGAGTVADKNVGLGKAVTNGTLALAGTDGGNYNLLAAGNTLTITKLDTNISGTRTYDQTNTAAAANLGTVSALFAGDVVTVSGSGTVADKNVGLSKAVTNGTLALAGTDGGNYNLLAAGNTLTIAKLDTTVSGSRVYDTTATAAGANLTTVSALFAGDVVTVSGSGTVADKNVELSKAVTNGTLALAGTDGGNYNLLAAGNTLTITQAPLVLHAVTGTKTYDTTTSSAGVVTNTGLLAGDSFTATQSFGSKNVLGLNGSTLSVNPGYTVSDGNGGANYSTTTTTALGTINPASLVLHAVTGTKTYDTTTSSAGVVTNTGLLAGDSFTATQSFGSKNVLGLNGSTLSVNPGYTVSDGNGGANYSTTTTTALGTINPASLVLHAVTGTKTYDTTASSAGVVTNTGLLAGDSFTATQSFGSKNVLGLNGSTLSVNAGYTVSDGNGGANYSTTTTTALGTITAKAVTLTAPSVTKTYDGQLTYTSTAGDLTSIGSALLAGDTVTAATIAYTNKDVGAGKTVNLNAVTLSDGNPTPGANYIVTRAGNSTSTITRLGSVTWVGPASGGLWSTAGNWAGGAIPDLANVADVNLNGASVSFTSVVPALAGSVRVNNVSNGSLAVGSGKLNIASNLNLAGYFQTGGATSTGGTFTVSNAFSETAGTISSTGNVNITAVGTLTPGMITSTAGSVMLTGGSIASGGTITGNLATLNSASDVTNLNIDFQAKSVLLTGSASTWNLKGPAAQPVFSVTDASTNIFYNGAAIRGAAVVATQQSGSVIGATLAEIARAALLEAQDTDSVAKIIDYGFAGDVGTTPPMDHRIDETGISMPYCFDESRDGQPCK